MTTLPTIHMNGTSKQMLLEDYLEAIRAVKDAQEAVRRIEFNARDYYVQGPDAFTAARYERAKLMGSLDEARAELEEIPLRWSGPVGQWSSIATSTISSKAFSMTD